MRGLVDSKQRQLTRAAGLSQLSSKQQPFPSQPLPWLVPARKYCLLQKHRFLDYGEINTELRGLSPRANSITAACRRN
jgi:hypothetical protein